MAVLVWLLWTLFSGSLGGPVELATWSELGAEPVPTDRDGASRPSFYRLPVFQDAPGPLVPPELLRPVPRTGPIPAGLSALLFATTRPPQQSVPGASARAVHVWCGVDKISVRVDRLQLRAWTNPDRFRLGSCKASRVSSRFLYFHYGLTDCGGKVKVADGQLVYTYTLSYTPPPQGYVIRVIPLHLPLHCQYNRFHYSYKVGFRPQVQHTTLMKRMRSKLSYSLTVVNAEGQPVPPGFWFSLGEPVYFVAQAETLLAGERLYVDSCYATSTRDPESSTRLDIITDYGCMTDSRRRGSSSRFLLGGGGVLAFSVDAFLFTAASQVLYLHCSMSVGLTASPTSKSCNYNQTTDRWEELEVATSVCSCCDSTCSDASDPIKNTVSSPGWLIRPRDEEEPRMKAAAFPAEEVREWASDEEAKEEKIGHENKNEDEKKEWRHRAEMREKEVVLVQTGPEEVLSTKPGVSSDNSSTNASRDGSGTSSTLRIPSFAADYNTSEAENVSTAAVQLCPDGPMSCSGAESFTPSPVRATSGTRVHVSQPDRTPEMSDINPSGSLSESESRLELDGSERLLRSRQVESVDAESGGSSKGPHGGDDTLHSLQIRGLESDPVFVDQLLGESDSDSGVEEGETLRLSQFTEAVETRWQKPGFSGSISSEREHQDGSSRSIVVAVSGVGRDSEGGHSGLRWRQDGAWWEEVSGGAAR